MVDSEFEPGFVHCYFNANPLHHNGFSGHEQIPAETFGTVVGMEVVIIVSSLLSLTL